MVKINLYTPLPPKSAGSQRVVDRHRGCDGTQSGFELGSRLKQADEKTIHKFHGQQFQKRAQGEVAAATSVPGLGYRVCKCAAFKSMSYRIRIDI